MSPSPQVVAVAGAPLWFIDNLAFVHVGGDQNHGAFSMVELRGRRGDMSPLHLHHRDDESFYVLDGEMTLFIAGREIGLMAGSAAVAPRGRPHTYRVESDTAAWLVVNSPAGFERFLMAVAEPAPRPELPPPGRPLDAAALTHFAAEHGIEILGPPGALPD